MSIYTPGRVAVTCPWTLGGLIIVSSSKTARLHRRQAGKKKRYARLRRAGRMPQHTQAERRLAAAERERKREADRLRMVRRRRAALPVAVAVTAASASVVFGAGHATAGIAHLYRPYSAADHFYPWVTSMDSDYPDPPHVPEPDTTFYSNFDAAGTARTDFHIGPVAPGTWLPWEWTNTNIFGD